MSTASWTSASVAPGRVRRRDVGGGEVARLASDRPRDVEQRAHLGVEALGRPDLDRVDQRHEIGGAAPLEERGRERAVRVHAVEAVVRRGDRGREHLALAALDRGPGKSLTSSSSARPRRWTPRPGVSRIAARIPGTSGSPPTIGSSCERARRSSSRAMPAFSFRPGPIPSRVCRLEASGEARSACHQSARPRGQHGHVEPAPAGRSTDRERERERRRRLSTAGRPGAS